MNSVAFDPNDPVQRSFLGALALGETGNSGFVNEGFGGVDLSGHPTDAHGFPQWAGGNSGTTHAAGLFQFQPGTWRELASQYGLNFQSASDQEAGAWYLAQQAYNAKTGGNLYDDLSTGNYGKLDQGLSNIWTSTTGNAAAPAGLAASLAGGQGANLPFSDRRQTPPPKLLVNLVAARARHHKAYLALLKTGSNAAA